jgi:hypothetical protein
MVWTTGIRFPAEAGNFSIRHSVQTGSGAHLASYPTGIEGYFPGGKAAVCETDYSFPSSAEVRNGAIPTLPRNSSRRGA